MSGMISPVLLPAWSSLPWLVHGFSTRAGGRGAGELNLGFTLHADRETILANRDSFLQHLLKDHTQTGEAVLVTLRQTHTALTHRVGHEDARLETPLEGDGMMTDEPGVMLGIQTADCVPVLVVDPERHAVAAFHAGWRGTFAQIVEQGIARMTVEFGSRPGALLAAVGPAIGACCYNVGEDLRMQFYERFSYASELFSENVPHEVSASRAGGLRLDLAAANRRQLLDAGLQAENITMTGECTSCQVSRFFSYRAEQGSTGRMLSVVGIVS